MRPIRILKDSAPKNILRKMREDKGFLKIGVEFHIFPLFKNKRNRIGCICEYLAQ